MRFIPMCIGNTGLSLDLAASIAVYPYVYREHSEIVVQSVLTSGLSLCV